MRQHTLTSVHETKKARRVGRGIAAGQGKTAGRGTKGQKSRTGYNLPRTFEGAASGLIQRLPKLKGFKSRRPRPVTINVAKLSQHFDDKAVISLMSLVEKGLIDDKGLKNGVKIVNSSAKAVKVFSYDTEDNRLNVSTSLQSK